MPIRSKILVILSVVIGLYALGDFFIQRKLVTGLFSDLEAAQAEKTTVRVKDSIDQQLQLLGARANDWAKNAGVFAYLNGTQPEFSADRLSPNLLEAQGIDLLYFCDAEGKVVWGLVRDPRTGQLPAPFDLAAFPDAGQGSLSDLLLTGWRTEDRARGILLPIDGFLNTEQGPLLVSSKPVSGGLNRHMVVGKVVLGRFLSYAFADEIRDRTEARGFRAWFHDPANAQPEFNEFVATDSGEPRIQTIDDRWLKIYHVVDARVDPAPLIISASVERHITRSGALATRYALVSMLAASLFLLLALLAILQKTVVAPLTILTRSALKVGRGEIQQVSFDLHRKDEIGVLAREFNHMLGQLALSRAAQVDSARQAGQSEIASGILHNVGNVLNSVNVSSGILAQRASEIAAGDLESLNEIIASHADDLPHFLTCDPRGKQFAPFLEALAGEIKASRHAITEEVAAMTEGIERIRRMVNSQQEFVRRTVVVEEVSLDEQVHKALKLSERVQPFDSELEIALDFQDLPRVAVDRHRLLEILINLIQNSRQAMESASDTPRRLSISLKACSERRVKIEVSDTGCGIDAEGLRHVFDHGYTTKRGGNGFGLHSSANAAGEMGAQLTALSDGTGCGATFVLELPTQPHSEPVEPA